MVERKDQAMLSETPVLDPDLPPTARVGSGEAGEASSGSRVVSDGAHLAEVPVSDFDQAEAGQVDAGVRAGEGAIYEGLISRDQFYTNFRWAFQAPNLFIRPPLRSLNILPEDQDARAASDALYDSCSEVSWLRWLVSPENKWAARAIVLGGFVALRVASATSELGARRAASARAPGSSPAAPAEAGDGEDAPPPGPEPDNVAAVTEKITP